MSQVSSVINAQHKQSETLRNVDPHYSDIEETILQQSLELFDFSLPLPDKPESCLRLFYNNCNGLEINNTIGVFLKQKQDKIKYNYLIDVEAPTKVDSLIRQMKRWNVDIVNLAETCVAWECKVPRKVIRQITNQYDKQGCWIGSSSTIDVGGFVKPGGTGILAMGKSNGKIQDKGVDPWLMGRWSYVLLGGTEKGSNLLIVTGYRTGYRTGTPGEKTAWAQQHSMLVKDGRPEKPPDAFLLDLKKWIRTYRRPGTEVIINLDANEKWSERSSITKFAMSLDLRCVNTDCHLSATHPNLGNITRSTTIDFCLCSPNNER